MAIGSAYSVRAMVYKWAPSWRSTDEDRRFGSGVNSGWSSLTTDASTTLLLWMTNGCAEFLESWKQLTEILWLNAISGIFHIPKAEISAALADSNYRVKGEHFGRREGLPGIAAQLRPLPTAIEGTDGRLWFTLRNAVVWLDPVAYSEKRTVPPPITIQSVAADDKSYAPASHLSLPAHTSSVQISYSAVSLTDPEAIRTRYKLQETDKDWHEAAAAAPLSIATFLPILIISALRLQIRTAPGRTRLPPRNSPSCPLFTRRDGS